MKTTIYFLVFFFAVWNTVRAQGKIDTSLKLQDIQLTNAPAFSLLDVSPSSIESPSSTKAFSASIVNALSQSNGIPQNYAIEFTPFWFRAHKKFTDFDYSGVSYNGKNDPFSQARFYAISFALINKDSSTNVGQIGNHNASLGIRATLIKIFKKSTRDRIVRVNQAWDSALQAQLHIFNGDVPTKAQLDAISRGLTFSDSLLACLAVKPLFSLDAAAASNMTFGNNSFSSNRLDRSGIWANANLSLDINPAKPASDYLTISVLGRYMFTKDSLDAKGGYISSNLTDFGGKAEFQFGNLSLAYEYIHRSSSDKSVGDTYKSVGLIKYKIKDGLFVTGALGQNFSTVNNVITALGLNWGFSSGNEKIQ